MSGFFFVKMSWGAVNLGDAPAYLASQEMLASLEEVDGLPVLGKTEAIFASEHYELHLLVQAVRRAYHDQLYDRIEHRGRQDRQCANAAEASKAPQGILRSPGHWEVRFPIGRIVTKKSQGKEATL